VGQIILLRSQSDIDQSLQQGFEGNLPFQACKRRIKTIWMPTPNAKGSLALGGSFHIPNQSLKKIARCESKQTEGLHND
jgi:hypothetical protein